MSDVFRVLRKFLVVVLIFLLAVSVGVFWFITFKGRPFLLRELGRITHREVFIGSIRVVFPLGLLFEKVEVKGLAQIAQIVVWVDVKEALRGRFLFSSADLVSPRVNLDLSTPLKEGEPVIAPSDAQGVVVRASAADRQKRILSHLKIHDGMVMLQTPKMGRTWVIEHVDVDARNVPLENISQHTVFKLSASLEQVNVPFVGHLIKMEGWFNWQARDMDGRLTIIDDDGRVGLSAALVSKNNDLLVTGKVRFLPGQQKQASNAKTRMVEDVVLELLEATGTEVDSEFSFKTLMDKPEVGSIKLTGTITTGLNSSTVSGNIVGAIKTFGAQVLGHDVEKH